MQQIPLGVGKHEFYMELQYMNWTNGNWTTAKPETGHARQGKTPQTQPQKR